MASTLGFVSRGSLCCPFFSSLLRRLLIPLSTSAVQKHSWVGRGWAVAYGASSSTGRPLPRGSWHPGTGPWALLRGTPRDAVHVTNTETNVPSAERGGRPPQEAVHCVEPAGRGSPAPQ